MNNIEWANKHIDFVKGLSKPSDQQKLLLLLVDKPKNSINDRKISAILKAERAQENANKAKAVARKIIDEEKLIERKARTRKLIELGALFDLAKLSNKNPAELLGALLAVASTEDVTKWKSWKEKGQVLLNEQIKKKKVRRDSVTQKSKQDVNLINEFFQNQDDERLKNDDSNDDSFLINQKLK